MSEYKIPEENLMCCDCTTCRRRLERIAALEAELDFTKRKAEGNESAYIAAAQRCVALEAENARLKHFNTLLQEAQANHDWWVKRAGELEQQLLEAQKDIARLKAQVSDEEKLEFGHANELGWILFTSDSVAKLIAARLEPSKCGQ